MMEPVEPQAIVRAEIEDLRRTRAEALQELDDLLQQEIQLLQTVRMLTGQLERRLESLDHRLTNASDDPAPTG